MRVTSLHIHPVKGCHALAVEEAALGPLGLERDRRFAFVGEDGLALTQRDQPLLATIRPALDQNALHLDFGGLAQASIPLNSFTGGVTVDVWGKGVPARLAPAAALVEAENYLGTTLRLAMLDPHAQRAFVDSRPVLVTTRAMLSSLNAQLEDEVGMERFRPNIVLEGTTDWTALAGNDVVLEHDKPCGRCEVTTIDQTSGERRGPEPLRTLSARFDGNFGVYCRVARPGRLRVGEVLKAS
jgi:uncharacterized protein YcbX